MCFWWSHQMPSKDPRPVQICKMSKYAARWQVLIHLPGIYWIQQGGGWPAPTDFKYRWIWSVSGRNGQELHIKMVNISMFSSYGRLIQTSVSVNLFRFKSRHSRLKNKPEFLNSNIFFGWTILCSCRGVENFHAW